VKPIVAAPRQRYGRPAMLNDRSSILSFLETRRSGKPRELVGPGPTEEELQRILTIGTRVPDHGKLHPWRFVTVAGDRRDALAAVFREALAEENPDARAAHFEAEDEFAHYPGQLVVLISAPIENHKIPVWEQQLSCGTVGMNLLLAAHAFGYVAGWVTGWRAYSPKVNAAFCAPGERIAGFIFIGHPARELEERERPVLAEVCKPWQPPQP
jgi:nitroreductase